MGERGARFELRERRAYTEVNAAAAAEVVAQAKRSAQRGGVSGAGRRSASTLRGPDPATAISSLRSRVRYEIRPSW